VSAGAPAAAPTNVPVVTDGATGNLSPTAGANWLTNYQGLQGDNDFMTAAATPAATTADQLIMMLTLFTGPNMATGTYTNVCSVKYTFGARKDELDVPTSLETGAAKLRGHHRRHVRMLRERPGTL